MESIPGLHKRLKIRAQDINVLGAKRTVTKRRQLESSKIVSEVEHLSFSYMYQYFKYFRNISPTQKCYGHILEVSAVFANIMI